MPRVKQPTPDVVAELEAASRAVASTRADLAAAVGRRDQAVHAATDAGMSLREIAAVAGVYHSRIQKIVDARRDL